MHGHITFPLLCSEEVSPVSDMRINKYLESWTPVECFYAILPALSSIGRKHDWNALPYYVM